LLQCKITCALQALQGAFVASTFVRAKLRLNENNAFLLNNGRISAAITHQCHKWQGWAKSSKSRSNHVAMQKLSRRFDEAGLGLLQLGDERDACFRQY
jgi:hypothetical protein